MWLPSLLLCQLLMTSGASPSPTPGPLLDPTTDPSPPTPDPARRPTPRPTSGPNPVQRLYEERRTTTMSIKKEKIPKGVSYNRGGDGPSSDHAADVEKYDDSGFPVESKHEKLTTANGVRFNVETLSTPLEKHLRKPTMTRQSVIEGIKHEVADHYNMELGVFSRHRVEPSSIRIDATSIKIEALSETEGHNLVLRGTNGFVTALVTAFAQHLPLTLAPDHIWILISYAFAKHVDKNAEALRGNFVKHQGKQQLQVDTPGNFRMSTNNNPDTGASAAEWEAQVFPKFSEQIKSHIGEKTHEAIASKFSTTTAAAGAAHEITLMSAMKKYFSYGMGTTCGIPNITLLGTEDDWATLRQRAEHLGSLMMPEFSTYWMPMLLPILDEFVESYRGNVHHGFWQSMVKLRSTAGSGAHSFISGWMQVLFPYVASGDLNEHLRPWHEMYFTGPEMDEFPPLFSTAAVNWEYDGTVVDITFHAGVLGVSQDPTSGALSPFLGWYVSHVPPKSKTLQLKDYKSELEDLLLGHVEDAKSNDVNTEAPWLRRVRFLQGRIAELLEEEGTGVIAISADLLDEITGRTEL